MVKYSLSVLSIFKDVGSIPHLAIKIKIKQSDEMIVIC